MTQQGMFTVKATLIKNMAHIKGIGVSRFVRYDLIHRLVRGGGLLATTSPEENFSQKS